MAVQTFPSFPGLTFPIGRSGPTFDTVVHESINGKQTTYPKRITPKWQWTIDFEMLRSSAAFLEMQTLAGFYASVLGRAYTFGYTDSEDNSATTQLFGTGDGVSLTFQILRAIGGFVEPVYLPTGSPTIFVNGTAMALGTDYVISVSGAVVFMVAPAHGAALTWTGSFNWLCRFDDDKVDFSNFMVGLWEAKKISFTSVIL
jgi:uncharacterized protein (TIGR02217 family)